MYIVAYRDLNKVYEVACNIETLATLVHVLNNSDFVIEFTVNRYKPDYFNFYSSHLNKWVYRLNFSNDWGE